MPTAHPALVNYFDVGDELISYYSGKQKEEVDRLRPVLRTEAFLNPFHSDVSQSGDVSLKTLATVLDSFGPDVRRSKDQRRYHRAMTRVVLQQLYGDTINTHADRLLKDNKWDRLMLYLMVRCGRREGKTWSVGMFTVAFMIAKPGSTQCIFSTGGRASGMLLELTKTLIGLYSKHKGQRMPACKIVKRTKETVWVQIDGGKISKINSFPAKAKISQFSFVFPFSYSARRA
jgi:hypothetical protein